LAEYIYKSKDFINPEDNPHDPECNSISNDIKDYYIKKKELWITIQFRYFSIYDLFNITIN
jgi:hypothetical protein